MNTDQQLSELSEIRMLMERSSRFISLSGLSGIFAGIFAIIGAGAAYWYLHIHCANHEVGFMLQNAVITFEMIVFLFADAVIVLIMAVSAGIFFTIRNSKKMDLPIWSPASKKVVFSMLIPLITGGIFALIMIFRHYISLLSSITLIFYGLALINASHHTHPDIKYLGIFEVIIGLTGLLFPGYGLLLWTIGFGILHIIYGIVMYYKYEKKAGKIH